MKDYCKVVLICIMGLQTAFAQTKIIAHKSHSGVPSTFSDKSSDNLGYVAPNWERKMYGAAKVIKLSDLTYVIVRKQDQKKSARNVAIEITDTVTFDNLGSSNSVPSKEEISNRYPSMVLVGFEDEPKKEESLPFVIPGNGGGWLLGLLLPMLTAMGWLIYRKEEDLKLLPSYSKLP